MRTCLGAFVGRSGGARDPSELLEATEYGMGSSRGGRGVAVVSWMVGIVAGCGGAGVCEGPCAVNGRAG